AEFAGLSAIPILVGVEDAAEFADAVEKTSRGFAAIHLEDIKSPACFEIEARLKRTLKKPVFHDDQHGTATAVLAALINATKATGRSLIDCRIGQIGLGAAGSAIARLCLAYGCREVLAFDASKSAQVRAHGFGVRPCAFDELLTDSDVVIVTTG